MCYIHRSRSQNSYTVPCYGVVSHGPPNGGVRRPHTWKQTQTKYVHKHCAPCGVSCIFIFALRSLYIGTWRIMVIFIVVKNPNTPNFSPMPGSRWRRFWDLLSIPVAKSQKLFGCQKLQSILLLIHSETKIVSRDNSKNWVNLIYWSQCLRIKKKKKKKKKKTRNMPYPVQNWKVNNIKLNELQITGWVKKNAIIMEGEIKDRLNALIYFKSNLCKRLC